LVTLQPGLSQPALQQNLPEAEIQEDDRCGNFIAEPKLVMQTASVVGVAQETNSNC
jgi:hypothetical protein